MRGLDPRICRWPEMAGSTPVMMGWAQGSWIPAFAGMTMETHVMRGLDPRICRWRESAQRVTKSKLDFWFSPNGDCISNSAN
jgi:hypothetical protein